MVTREKFGYEFKIRPKMSLKWDQNKFYKNGTKIKMTHESINDGFRTFLEIYKLQSFMDLGFSRSQNVIFVLEYLAKVVFRPKYYYTGADRWSSKALASHMQSI